MSVGIIIGAPAFSNKTQAENTAHSNSVSLLQELDDLHGQQFNLKKEAGRTGNLFFQKPSTLLPRMKSGVIKGGVAAIPLEGARIYYEYQGAPGTAGEKTVTTVDNLFTIPFTPELIEGGLLSHMIKSRYPSERVYELGTAITALESCLDSYNRGNGYDVECAIPKSLLDTLLSRGEQYTALPLISEKTLKEYMTKYYQSLSGAFEEKEKLFMEEYTRVNDQYGGNEERVKRAIKKLEQEYETELKKMR